MAPEQPRRGTLIVAAVMLGGLALGALMLSRVVVGGDQLNLLARGWLLVHEGTLVPYGNPTSGGGTAPGPATSILVGLPLFAWEHHRSPALLIFLLHIPAFLLLDRVMRPMLNDGERVWFAILYWLSPWRLYLSTTLWNPGYLFALGAVHLWSAFRLRERSSFGMSLMHILAIGIAFQLHLSALLLAVLSGLLIVRRSMRLDPTGTVTAMALLALSMLPWYLAVRDNPAILPVGHGFPFRGLVTLFPLLRGLFYWIRYPTFHLSGTILRFEFGSFLDERANSVAAAGMTGLVYVAALLTVLISLKANLSMWKSPAVHGSVTPPGAGREWLERYARLSLITCAIVFAAQPTTVMWWQGVPLFHAALLPVVFWFGNRGSSFWRVDALRIYAALSLIIALSMAAGSPRYRCEGKRALRFPLHQEHPMLRDLHIQQTCPWPIDPAHTWMPDVLR